MKYRVTYNSHRYSDLSDPARSAKRTFEAKNRDALDVQLEVWRQEQNEIALTGNRRFVGLIRWGTIKAGKP